MSEPMIKVDWGGDDRPTAYVHYEELGDGLWEGKALNVHDLSLALPTAPTGDVTELTRVKEEGASLAECRERLRARLAGYRLHESVRSTVTEVRTMPLDEYEQGSNQ